MQRYGCFLQTGLLQTLVVAYASLGTHTKIQLYKVNEEEITVVVLYSLFKKLHNPNVQLLVFQTK